MQIKKLATVSLIDALKGMKVGETCVAPDGYKPRAIIATCSNLRNISSMIFRTYMVDGVQHITRIQ